MQTGSHLSPFYRDSKCDALNAMLYFSFWKAMQINCVIYSGLFYVHHSPVHSSLTFLSQLPDFVRQQHNAGTVLFYGTSTSKQYCQLRLLINFKVISMFDMERFIAHV